MPLAGVRILLVEDDEDSRELLAQGLTLHGAMVESAESGEAALEIAHRWRPDVLLADLRLPGIDGVTTLARVRALTGLRATPAIALSGNANDRDRTLSLAAGFAKHLSKPATLRDIVASIDAVSLGAPGGALRARLAAVNAASSCRFTSILRFADHGTLISVWTYDRERPDADPFPLDVPIEASYCVLVREARATVAIEDAAVDPIAADHPKRTSLAAYIGVPLLTADGQLFGTLCSYDAAPRPFSPAIHADHERAAIDIAPILAKLFGAA